MQFFKEFLSIFTLYSHNTGSFPRVKRFYIISLKNKQVDMLIKQI